MIRDRRRIGAPILIACLTAVLASCSTGVEVESSTVDAGPRPLEDLSIGVFLPSSDNAYQQASARGAEEAAAELGIELEVVTSSWDAQAQNTAFQLAMQRETYDAWIAMPISPAEQCDLVKEAGTRGIPVIIVATAVCGDADHTPGTTAFVGEQGLALYEEWFGYIYDNTTPGKMSVVTGPPLDFVTETTTQALDNTIGAAAGFEVSAVHETDYLTESAFQATQTTLRSEPDLTAMISNFAGMTRGVVEAVEQAGRTDAVQVYDCNGDTWSKAQIQAGVVEMTLPGAPYSNTNAAVELMAQHWQGKDVAEVTNPLDSLEFDGAPFVTSENVDQWTPEY